MRMREVLYVLFTMAALTSVVQTNALASSTSIQRLQEIRQGASDAAVSLPAGYAWYKFANHTHTDHSGTESMASVAERIAEAGTYGADSVSITDHRTSSGCSDPGFAPANGCQPMCGEEWGNGSSGHAGLLNISPGESMNGWALQDMIAATHTRGGLVIINHPFSSPTWWPTEDLPFNVDGTEIWSMVYNAIFGNPAATQWWDLHLAKGRIVLGVGGSDVHFLQNDPLQPCNTVMATSADPDAIEAGLSARHVSVSQNGASGRCFFWCDQDGDGTFETPMGDLLSVTAPKTLTFRVEVFGGEGEPMHIVTSTGQMVELTVGSGDPWSADFSASVDATTKDFIRAEVTDPSNGANLMIAMTNPFYINYTPGDADSDGFSDTQELAATADPYAADTDQDGLSDGFEAGYDGNPAYNPYDPATNPTGTDLNVVRADTDGDGVSDNLEILWHNNPLDANDVPALRVSSVMEGFILMVALMACLVASRRMRNAL